MTVIRTSKEILPYFLHSAVYIAVYVIFICCSPVSRSSRLFLCKVTEIHFCKYRCALRDCFTKITATFHKLYQFGYSVIFPRNYLPVGSLVVTAKKRLKAHRHTRCSKNCSLTFLHKTAKSKLYKDSFGMSSL